MTTITPVVRSDAETDASLPPAVDVRDGQHPQHLLLTLLGDYWMSEESVVPSGALVDLLAEFGVSTAGARAALSRLARRGLLMSSKSGRRTYYRLTERARRVLTVGLDRIVSFGSTDEPWDGVWTYVAFSIPESQRSARHQLRTKLRWLGFAPLYDGLWVSPKPLSREAQDVLAEVGVASATVLSSRELGSGTDYGRPIDAWDLNAVRAEYDAFISRMEPIRSRLRAGGVSPSEALRARSGVMDEWRVMPNIDPELPAELLPALWPRKDARDIFRTVYDDLGDTAVVRVRQIVGAHSPELVDTVSVHGSGE